MEKAKLFSFFIKFAMALFFIEAIMLFIVDFLSAEFYILLFSMVLMLIMIIFGFIKTRKEMRKNE